MTDKCPACGSEAVGIAETFGQGTSRFRPVCADCRWTTIGGWSSIQEAFDVNRDLFAKWDRGEKVEGDVRFDETVQMVSGEKRAPSVGELRLEGIARASGADVRQGAFRDQVEQSRYEAGQPVVKTYVCEECRCTQSGAEVKGNYFAVPTGWYLHHPSARLFCSAACVGRDAGER